MKPNCNKKCLLWIPFAVGIFAGVIYILMLLWNWLMPEIFGLTTINFWQAAGLMLMSKILFGIWGGGKCGWKDKRHKLSDEERHKFKEAFRTRFCNDKTGEDER